MLWKKEKKVKKMLSEQASIIKKTLEAMSKTLNYYINGDLLKAKNSSYDIHCTESNADIIRRNIIQTLYQGAFFPNLRTDIAKFIILQDKIADRAEYCGDFMICQKPDIRIFNPKELQDLIDNTLKAYDCLIVALNNMSIDIHKINKELKNIQSLEEKIDKCEWDIISKLFESDIDLAEKNHLSTFIRNFTKLSDLIEDAADFLEILSLKIIV